MNDNKKINEEYKIQIACKQVSTILNCYNQDLLKLTLPKEVLERLKENSATDYEYSINIDNFDPNTLTDESLALLLLLFNDYFATKGQKIKINAFLAQPQYTQYDYNKIFKQSKKHEVKNNNVQPTNQLVVYSKKNILKQLVQKLKRLFLR